jgi:photosystem II stability/assembly factor-like uncharacterized protein
MTEHLYLATAEGLVIAQRDGDAWHIAQRTLAGHDVTSVVARGDVVLAGTTDGIMRSTDGGATWQEANQNLAIRRVRWLAAPAQGLSLVLVGTQPAAIYVSRDGGETWVSCPEVAELRDAHGWYLPYAPEAGCVRGFAVHGSEAFGARAFAAVEVGGVLHTTDGGDTWQLVEGSDGNPDMYHPYGALVHPDVHSITVHPAMPDLITAPTGGGLYRSDDGGATWQCLYRCYCRAVWVDPADPAHIVFGPADGVSEKGRIEETADGGKTWHLASDGLDVPWPSHMVERFAQAKSELLAVLSNGELLSSPLQAPSWQRILPDVGHVRSVSVGTS